jgi:hypothetical protein
MDGWMDGWMAHENLSEIKKNINRRKFESL